MRQASVKEKLTDCKPKWIFPFLPKAAGKRNSLELKDFFHKELLAYYLNHINRLHRYQFINPDVSDQYLPFIFRGGLSYDRR
jgi:hypothetical protein